MGSRDVIWSVIVTVALSVIGYLYLDIQTLREEVSKTGATRFTARDGADLRETILTGNQTIREDITDVTSDIDKRMAVIETHIQYLASGNSIVAVTPSPATPRPVTRPPSTTPSSAKDSRTTPLAKRPFSREPEYVQQRLRRYDLRIPEQRTR